MTAPDFSEHFGPVGELIIGLIGFLLLALMHKDVRRFAWNRLARFGRAVRSLHASLAHNNAFYGDWVRAFLMIFRDRRDLFLIVIALTAFDYLTGWHADFMINRFDLSPTYESYDFLNVYITFIFSAPFALALLKFAGYALFCWLAYRTASGVTYREASTFKPLPQLAALFLCLYGAQAFADSVTPSLFMMLDHLETAPEALAFLGMGVAIFAITCAMGVALLTRGPNGAHLATPLSTILGFLLATHLLQWIYFFLDRTSMTTKVTWVRLAEYHASNFTYTLLWNIVLVAFAVRLSGPPKAHTEMSHHAANAV